MTTSLRRRRAGGREEGFALLTVLVSMMVLSMFLLTTLAFTVDNMRGSRQDQDAKAALAAAQAGLEEYLARLNANDTYWSSTDCGNLALVPKPPAACPVGSRGVRVPGAGGEATFSYRLLTTNADTTRRGVVQLAVTGRSRDRTRELVAELSPVGFLQYLYFTDKEVVDPAVDTPNPAARLNGNDYAYDPSTGVHLSWRADRTIADTWCSKHWYAGRDAPSYTSGKYLQTRRRVSSTSTAPDGSTQFRFYAGQTVTEEVASTTRRVTFSCGEIQFTGGDTVEGKLKTNDALLLDGSPLFLGRTETAWPNPPTPSRPWRGTGTPAAGSGTRRGYAPVMGEALQMPLNNDKLRTEASNPSVGCVYRGETRLVYQADGTVLVTSPETTSTSACGGGTSPVSIRVPLVMYVEDLPAGQTCTNRLGYPASGEYTGTELTTTVYDCRKGNAYVSGVVKGRTTVATANDIVVVRDTTYKDGLDGTDALGLIPQNYVWIYHPVKSDGNNLFSYDAPAVKQLDAAVLSVHHSFLVQNYNLGRAIAPKLRVRGAIAQRYRGPVGTGGDTPSGYLKDYQYDPRLAYAPPPYFLKPVNSPYVVSKVTD